MAMVNQGKAIDRSHLDKAIEVLADGREILIGRVWHVSGDPRRGAAWLCCSEPGCCDMEVKSVEDLWEWMDGNEWESEDES